MTKKKKKKTKAVTAAANSPMSLWNATPQAVKDAIDDRFGIPINSKSMLDDFNPSAPYFAVSTWENGHGILLESLDTEADVKGLINKKLSRDAEYAFDLVIYDSAGQEYTWKTQITLVKV